MPTLRRRLNPSRRGGRRKVNVRGPSQAAIGAEERGQLIPGLPEDIVVAQVVPRLPWFTRPLCRALSKSWRTTLDTRNTGRDLRTRTIQLPLLRVLFLLATLDKEIFIRDEDVHEPDQINGYQIQPHWRKLPPWKGSVVDDLCVVASSGMVYAWSPDMWSVAKGSMSVLKLDLGCAEWTWKKVPVPYVFSSDAVSYNGKIYVQGFSRPDFRGEYVLVEHDTMTDICREVETWSHSELRVLSRKSAHSNACVEEMYGFVEKEGIVEKLGVVMYDAGSDAWRTRVEVPIPVVPWSDLSEVQLLNSDCFEPAPEIGFNIVWYDYARRVIFWFLSSGALMWADIDYNHPFNRRYFNFVRGSMYGVFCDEEQDKVIMKGRIIVESRRVVWEEVHDIGFFPTVLCQFDS